MKVLAYIDSSRYVLSTLDHAAWAATRLDIPLELVHVIEKRASDPRIAVDRSGRLGVNSREALLNELVALDEQRNRLEQESGRHLLEDAATHVRSAGAREVLTRLVHGGLVDHLRDHEQEARLLVIGKRGEGEEQAEVHLGSNLERVIRASHRPILIAPQAFRPVNRFLFAFDGGPSTGNAVDRLVTSPLLREAHGTLVTVGEDSSRARQRLHDAASRLRAAGYTIDETIRPGEADDVIPEMLEHEDIDLLVMGAYGHSRIRELLVGSTTTHLLRTSTKAVIVIR
jgi:nucleotide-binding universal stress UspA family protein